MIRQSTSDLITRAKQLADLENSDYISWRENVMAVNEIYQKIYQKAINKGDKYYLKECILEGSQEGERVCYKLPQDFWQLYALNDIRTNRNLLRQTANGLEGSFSYDIMNDNLVVYGSYNSLRMRYYPAPRTLAYSPANVDFELFRDYGIPNNISLIDCCENYIYWAKEASRSGEYVTWNINRINWKGGDVETIQTSFHQSETFDLIAGPSKVHFLVTASDTYKLATIDWNTKSPSSPQFQFFDKDKNDYSYYDIGIGNVAYFATDKGNHINIGPNGREYFRTFISRGSRNDHVCQGAINNNLIVFYDLTEIMENASGNPDQILFNLKVYNTLSDSFENEIVSPVPFFKYMIPFGASFAQFDKWTKQLVALSADLTTSDTVLNDIIGVMKQDTNTGYGAISLHGTKGVIKPIIQDTIIDYPNNLFISLISYRLAILYKNKQGGDINGLTLLAQDAEEQFYDSLTRDSFQTTRIENVY